MWRVQPIQIVEDYDASDGSVNWDIVVPNEPDLFFDMSIQVNYTGLTGVLNGTLVVQQSSDGVNFVNYGLSHNMTATPGTAIFELNSILVPHIRVAFTVVGITGGTINAYKVLKRKAKP